MYHSRQLLILVVHPKYTTMYRTRVHLIYVILCMCYTLFTNYKGRVRLSFTLFYACLFNICYMYGHTLSKKYRGVPGCLRHKKTTITTYHSPQKMYNSIMKPGSHLAFLSQHVLQKKHGQCKMAHDKGLDL